MILTTELPYRQGGYTIGGLGEKLNKICPAQRNMCNDLASEGKLQNPGAPAQITQTPNKPP